jgi:hypothetical protein
MHRQIARPEVGRDLRLSPAGQGVDLDPTIDVFDDVELAALAAMIALAAGDQACARSPFERQHLADMAGDRDRRRGGGCAIAAQVKPSVTDRGRQPNNPAKRSR